MSPTEWQSLNVSVNLIYQIYGEELNQGDGFEYSIFNVFISIFIVSRGDWLGKPANIKVESNSAAVYVGSSLTVHNPLYFVHKL